MVIQAMHAGPLPHPSQLAEYEAVHPGAAAWIIEQAEKNAEHVRTMEQQALQVQRLDIMLHRLLPFALVVVFLVASVVITFVSPLWGGITLIGTMAGVLIAYLTGRAPNSVPSAHDPPHQQ